MDVCRVSKHEPFSIPFSLQSEIKTKCRLCAFLNAQPSLFFLQNLSRLNIYSLSSRTHYHMPQTQIEKWMNWASKHEPFLLSMAKWQINIKLCDFFQRLFSIFFVLYFSSVKYGSFQFQRIIKRFKQTSRSDFLMRLNLSHFSFFAGKWQKM